MQNSIWKIVTAVGIIGIGTLVVLEVQQRLPQMQQGAAAPPLPEDAQEFVEAQGGSAGQDMTPDSSTDFDKLTSSPEIGHQHDHQGSGTFDFSEPVLTEGASNTPSATSGASAANPEISTDSSSTAQVNTEVRRSAMFDGQSPFAANDAHAEVDSTTGDSLQGAPQSGSATSPPVMLAALDDTTKQNATTSDVKTVAFQQNNPFAEDRNRTSSPSGSSATAVEFPPMDFSEPAAAATSSRSDADLDGNPFAADGSSPPVRPRDPAASENPILFFSADPSDDAAATPGTNAESKSAQASEPLPSNTEDFFSDDTRSTGLPPLPPASRELLDDHDPFPSLPRSELNRIPEPESELPAFEPDPPAPQTGTRPQPQTPVGRFPSSEDTGRRPRGENIPASEPDVQPKVREFSAQDVDPFTADDRPAVSNSAIQQGSDVGTAPPLNSSGQPFFTEDSEPAGRSRDRGRPDENFTDDNVARPDRSSGPSLRPVPSNSGNVPPGRDSMPSMDLPFPDPLDMRDRLPDAGRGRSSGVGGVSEFDQPFGTGDEFPPLPERPASGSDRTPSLDPAPGTNPFGDHPLRDPRRTPEPFDSIGPGNGDPLDEPAFPRLPTPGRGSVRPDPANAPGIAPGTLTGTGVATASEVMRPHVTLRKDAPETASVGVALEYVITITNEGQGTAFDVTVEDEVAPGVNLQNTAPVADFDRTSRKLSWKFTELQPQEQKQIRVSVVPTGEGMLDSTASVRFKAQVKASTVITAPRLSLRLTGPSEVRLGDEVNFRYLVRNDGSGNASDVILRSVLPAGLKHLEGNDLEYEISSLASGEEREILLTVVAAEPGEFRNTAEVTSSGVATAATDTAINIVGAQLKVERLGPERRYVGRPAQFQNIITNDTNFEATNCVVLEQVPVGMKFVSAPSADYNPQDRVITWNIDRIAPGKQVVLDVHLTPEVPGDVDTIVEVVENAGFRSQATKTVAVEDIHNVSADISRLDGPVAVGEKFTFSITVDNRGTAGANSVQLTIQVPKEIKVIAAGSKETGITARHQLETNAVLYNPIVLVEPGHVKTFQLVLQGQQPVRNALVKAHLKYAEMQEPLVVSESVTVYSDSL